MSDEEFEKFLCAVIGGNSNLDALYINNSVVNSTIRYCAANRLDENQTLRAIIVTLVNIQDDDLQRKMIDAITSVKPPVRLNYPNGLPHPI